MGQERGCMNKREAFVTVLNVLGESFNRPMTEGLLEGYWMALQDLSTEEMQAAGKRALQECKFMPAPSELLAFVGRGPRDFAFETAKAWEAVVWAMNRYDYTDSVDFGPLVNAVIRNLGGWVYLCNQKLPELVWRRKDFERLYEAFASKPVDQLNGGYLPGEHKTEIRRIAINGVTPPKMLPAKKEDPALEMRAHIASLVNGKTL